ncbi:C-type lectin domain family 2 member B-like isoform 2-T2 [Ciconia maguari]
MSENLIYADLNLTESTRPRLQKVTDVQGSTYAEVKVQSLDTNGAASYTSSDHRTASSPPDSKTFSTTQEEAIGCSPRWEKKGKKCYFFSEIQGKKDWNASRKECTDMNSDLVIIDNMEELDYLTSRSSSYYYLLGLTYSKSENKWKWINGMEHSTNMFLIGGDFTDYFCTVIGHGKVETASCGGSSTTQNMCEKDANVSERQKES